MIERYLKKLLILVPLVLAGLVLGVLGLCFLAYGAFLQLSVSIGDSAAAQAVGAVILVALLLCGGVLWLRLNRRARPPSQHAGRGDSGRGDPMRAGLGAAASLTGWVQGNPKSALALALAAGALVGGSPATRRTIEMTVQAAIREFGAGRGGGAP